MTNKGFSMGAFIAYGNNKINNVSGNDAGIQTAFKTDLKKAIAHAGYPNKDEIGIIDEINDFDMTNTLEKIPEIVSGFMADEQREFNIPAANDKTCPAAIAVVHKDEETSEGVSKMGGVEKPWKSTTLAHDELKVKNRRDGFKVK